MPDDNRSLRWSVYAILIAIAVGQMTGRIFAVNSVDMKRLEEEKIKTALADTEKKLRAEGVTGETLAQQLDERRAELNEKIKLQRPFLSSNDRSRWAAIRALVEQERFEIDDIQAEPTWDTIDMVKHRDASGEYHLYSSKPPLVSTLYAVPYWLIYKTTGCSLGTHPYEIGRGLLLLFNIVPLVVFYILLARLVEEYGRTDWAKIFVVAVGTLGTFLNTFAVVLNNHIPGAVCVIIALYAALRVWYDDRREWKYFAIAGFFAAMAVADEMPALSFLTAVMVAMFWRAPRESAIAMLPVVVLVAAAYFGTNYVAHNSLRPPYMHRSHDDPEDDWYRYTYDRGARKGIVSHWTNPKGIDHGEPSPGVYTFNALVGQHGIFSLTPVWFISIAGVILWARKQEPDRRALALLIGSISVVCIAFYLMRPQADRNYGGMTSGFRWAFWMIPLWLLAMLPALDAMASCRRGRIVAGTLLAFSCLAAAYPTWNPWTLPMWRTFGLYMGWSELPD